MADMPESARKEREDKIAEEKDRGEKQSGNHSTSTQASSSMASLHGPDSQQEQPFVNIPSFGNMWYPWTFDPSALRASPECRAPDQTGLPPMMPILLPMPYPGSLMAPLSEDQQRMHSGGIFAVPVVPVLSQFPPGSLIPIPQNVPQGTVPYSTGAYQGATPGASQFSERAAPVVAEGGNAVVQHRQLQAPAGGQAQRPEGPRPVVRRFHIAFRIDLLLILKLAVVVFVFNQEGSRDRLILLLFLAVVVYLYQTGALTPLLRWISQSAHRAMAPPQQLQPAPAAPADVQGEGRGDIQDANAAANVPPAAEAAAQPAGEGAAAVPAAGPDPDAALNQARHQQAQAGPNWWGFFKEVQMLVVGFVTSLLPGFHQHAD